MNRKLQKNRMHRKYVAKSVQVEVKFKKKSPFVYKTI
jgi:hypothetical protein